MRIFVNVFEYGHFDKQFPFNWDCIPRVGEWITIPSYLGEDKGRRARRKGIVNQVAWSPPSEEDDQTELHVGVNVEVFPGKRVRETPS